ncbi:hypothetical protein CDG60_08615 [Acinetobacter chinensis]|jgi:hypothetical protein|uniref:Uncharacterized protein n=1 Tax=Acinetobacter chinensis TaxID=2004650 RepID=A0A3B7LXC8_9GAMM|nr:MULTISPECIES: hypothetical protein [Acinetobacter]AXY56624.1 hypothetical protein CDG60_08615 [Acinetobacter chinensis]AXY60009.1 hypothetical protein CDG61_08215 [Acinetobacter sp. WCHAc010052]MDV2468312.1 hypothetical protein [Acinetobacter chinensis]WOE43069.1 hypothetical protein QSG87_08125 [Acinetobacter chinensis]
MNTSLEKVLVNVVDQHGAVYTVDAMCERSNDEPNSFGDCIRCINIDDEIIKPSLDLHFHSNKTGKVFKLS